MNITIPDALKNKTILIVDDHVFNLKIIIDALQDYEFEIVISQDGASALNQVNYAQPDLILLDVMMPGIDGFETCRRLKSDPTVADIPVIFMTALSSPEDKIRGFEAGGVDYITKPIQIEEVLARIKIHLSLRHAHLELKKDRDALELRVQERTAELKQSMSALEESRAKFQNIFETMQVGYVLVHLTGEILLVNPATAHILGYDSPEELIGKDIAQTLFVNSAERQQVVADILAAGQVTNYELIYKCKDGRLISASCNTHLVCDIHGKPFALEGLFYDITERKLAEASLSQWEQIFKNANWGIATSNPETDTLDLVNPAFARMNGYTVEELIGQPVENLYPPEERDKLRKAIRLAHTQGHYTFETVLLRKDHTTFPVLVNLNTTEDKNRDLQYRATNVHDISKIKQTRQALQQRNQELEVLNRIIAVCNLASEPNAILEIACRELGLFFKASGVIAFEDNPSDQTATIVAGYDATGKRTIPLNMTLSTTDIMLMEPVYTATTPLAFTDIRNELALKPLRVLLDQTGTVSLLFLPLVTDQTKVGSLILDTTQPHHFSTEEINLAWGIAQQVSGVLTRAHLNQQQQQLAVRYHQAQKMESIGRLAGGIAHDFNNLLVPIIGYAELGMVSLSSDSELYENLNEVKSAAERGAELTRQILVFSRQDVLEKQPLNLNQVITNFKKTLQHLIGRNIKMNLYLEDDLLSINADPGKLEQILLNFVVNARDAMPNGGELFLETSNFYLDAAYARRQPDIKPGPYAMLAVSDTGHGMDTQTIERIFDPFFTTKEQGKGTGLGLATVFGIVKQHQGSIWVYSEPDQGTTFKVYLPQSGEGLTIPQPHDTPSVPARGSETILVVEDEPSVRTIVYDTLKAHGYNVLQASDPNEGLNLAFTYQGTIHLLLSDVILPQMNGPELHKKITGLIPDLKVIYMSGYTDNMILQQEILDKNIA